MVEAIILLPKSVLCNSFETTSVILNYMIVHSKQVSKHCLHCKTKHYYLCSSRPIMQHTACHWYNKGFEFFIVFFLFHLMVCGQCSFIIAELGHSCHQQERMNKKQTDEDKELWVGWDSATYFVMCKRVKMTILFLHFGKLQWCCLV